MNKIGKLDSHLDILQKSFQKWEFELFKRRRVIPSWLFIWRVRQTVPKKENKIIHNIEQNLSSKSNHCSTDDLIKIKIDCIKIKIDWSDLKKSEKKSDGIGLQWITLYRRIPRHHWLGSISEGHQPASINEQNPKIKIKRFFVNNLHFYQRGSLREFCPRAETRGDKTNKQDIEGDQSNFSGGPSCGLYCQRGPQDHKSFRKRTTMTSRG